MESFWEYVIVIGFFAVVLLIIVGIAAAVLRFINALAEPDGIDDPEKAEKIKRKHILWMIFGVIAGWAFFGG